jgi:hypothetical protein
MYLSFGLQAGVTNRSVDYSKLIFSDQIDPSAWATSPALPVGARTLHCSTTSSILIRAPASTSPPGISISAALCSISTGQTNRSPAYPPSCPCAAFSTPATAITSPRTITLDEDQKSYVIPSVVFYKQAQSQSVSVGFQYKRRSINAGLWYRSGSLSNGPSSVVVSFIFDLFINRDGGEKMRLGVSHDVPSGKGLNYSNTSGTTEGSIGYETTLPYRGNDYRKFNGNRRCYDFY